MSTVVTFTHMHPQMPIKTNAQLQTIGSIVTLFDFVLVNGGSQVNIVSITRAGLIATVETSVDHELIIGDKVIHDATGEDNFNGIKRIESVINSTTYTFKCEDLGELSTGAVGTSKLMSAGWTKFITSGNKVVYQSANLYDGEPLFIQIDDYSNNYYKIRSARGLTALDSAAVISPEGFMTKGLNGTLNFVIMADNKGAIIGHNQMYSYSFGYGKKLEIEEEAITQPSVFSISSTTTHTVSLANTFSLFGVSSNFCNAMIPANAHVYILSNGSYLTASTLGVTTLLGTPRSVSGQGGSIYPYNSPIELQILQSGFKGLNSKTGKIPLIPVDLWEKVGEVGEVLTPNCRVRGLYQSFTRLPTEYVTSQQDSIIRTKIEIDGVEKNFVIYNCGSTILLSTQLFVNVDSWDD